MSLNVKGDFMDPIDTVPGVYGRTHIHTGEGPKILQKIVEEKWAGKVKSVDREGNIVWKNIIGWYSNPRNEKELYKISFIDGKSNGIIDYGTVLSVEHPILTRRGYIAVGNLREDDLIATGDPLPGPRAEQGLQGTLLGDGNISKNEQLSEQHSIKQKEYLQQKIKLYAPLMKKSPDGNRKSSAGQEYSGVYSVGLKSAGKLRVIFYYSLNKSYYFHDLRKKWYPLGVKIIPQDLHQTLDLFGVAIWYMDDGHYNKYSSFALGNRTQEEVEYLQSILRNFGFESKKFQDKRGYWDIVFNRETTKGFLTAIAKYVPESMRYKLHEEACKIPFDSSFYEPEEAKTGWRRVKVIPYSTHHPRTLYSIDVESTHNFFTPGGIMSA